MSLYFALLTVENNQNKKSVKFQGGMFNFCDFIQVFVFTRNPNLKARKSRALAYAVASTAISNILKNSHDRHLCRQSAAQWNGGIFSNLLLMMSFFGAFIQYSVKF